ncbi:Serine/threonine-protein phosphatase 6 regulatory ankyrin repeat subunit B [Linum perenne]
MPPTYLPLRWESTGDQWWYAAPIDWAAANGHYDLVRELLRIDNNHLINLTSLRRIRRLESVWDDEEQFIDVAKCRSHVARKLFLECESSKRGKNNSLVQSGYGGWLIYTAASAGDLSFVQELLQMNPLLVFGEGEYGVTDILYAASRSKNTQVFRLIYDFAVSPRFLTTSKGGGELEEHLGDIPSLYKWEMLNRALHAAARGGNVAILKDLLSNCTSDILSYRDKQGSTILHAAAAKGQVEVIKYLTASFDNVINSTDNLGNTALHTAAYRGQLHVVEALIEVYPSVVSSTNNAGETFLHITVSGFQNPAFRRLDKQVELMKKLISGGKGFHIEQVINAKNNDGRTALHTAILANVHSDLVQLLMGVKSIHVNARDADGMTPLDLLKQRPRSASSDYLIRQLISAGGMFGGCQDYTARRAIASRLKIQGGLGSPGTSFRVSDTEVFLYTGIEVASSVCIHSGGQASAGMSSSSSIDLNQLDYYTAKESQPNAAAWTKQEHQSHAARRIKRVLQWTRRKHRKPGCQNSDNNMVKSAATNHQGSVATAITEEERQAPLRQRFAKPSSASTSTSTPTQNNKRTLAVRSNQSSPTSKKKLASGLVHGVLLQALPQITTVPGGKSLSSSFSRSSLSSPGSMDKAKGFIMVNEGEASCSNTQNNETPRRSPNHHRRSRSQYFCFGGAGLSVKSPVSRHRRQQSATTPSVVSVA